VSPSYTLKNLTKAVEKVESGGDPNAVSPKGARGRMQVLPTTAKKPGFGVTAARDSTEKEYTRVGKDYLKAMVKRYGPEAGLVAYNWGPGNAEKWIKGGRDKSKLPDETRDYLIKVDNLASNSKKDRRKTTMASKSDILKRIRASKKGKPTWQDKNRLKTWRDAGKGSNLQKEGYDRAVRNMQRSSQRGQQFNEVDTQIFSAYVKETPEELLSKSKTFMNLATWFPVGGLAANIGSVVAKKLAKPLSAAAKRAAKKDATAATKKAKTAAAKLEKEASKRGDPTPRTVGAATREVVKAATASSTKKATQTTAREAANLKKRVERARKAAEEKKRMEIFRRVGESGRVPANLDKVVKAAGNKAATKETAKHTAKQIARRTKDQAKKVKGRQIKGAAALAAVPVVVALTGDEKNEKKVPKPKKKPTGSEVFWERAKRARAARAAEQKAITRSRAGRKTGIGAGRKAARVATAPPKNLLKKDKSASSTERELKSWEGGVRHADLPEWLGGGRVKIDSSDEAMNTSYPGEEYKKGGRLKKIVKKSKAKPHKAKTKTRQVAKKPRGVGVARKGYGKAMHG